MANTKQDKEPIYFFDTVTGTYGDARGLIFVPTSQLGERGERIIEEGSDYEIMEFAGEFDVQDNEINVKFRELLDSLKPNGVS